MTKRLELQMLKRAIKLAAALKDDWNHGRYSRMLDGVTDGTRLTPAETEDVKTYISERKTP